MREMQGKEGAFYASFDADSDGKLSKSEFENALGAGGTNLKQADSVLIQGASSGVGLMALMIAKEMGAGLVIGGVPSALLAGGLLKVAPRKPLMIAVGLLICSIAGFELSKVLF